MTERVAAAGTGTVDSPVRVDGLGEVEQNLVQLMTRARANVARAARQIDPELGTGAYPILLHISDTGGVRITDLATHFGVGKPTMSRQVAAMERLGLVLRRVDPADRRGALVMLSAEGERRFAVARRQRRDWLVATFADFSDDEVRSLGSLLGRFVEHGFRD